MSRVPSATFSSFGDDLAPGFDLRISGKDASESSDLFRVVRALVAGISYEDDEELSSMLELTIINQPELVEGQPIDWRAVLDSKAFAEGNFVDLFMGYGSRREFVGRVEIVRWLPKLGEDQTLTIKGYDGRHRMQKGNARVKGIRRKQKRRTFYQNKPDEAIVKAIADKYGFGVDVDPTEVKKQEVVTIKKGKKITQHVIPTRVQVADTSDWDFLQKLAKIHRFDLWVSFDQKQNRWVVNFKKRPDSGTPKYKFEYHQGEGSLLSAEPDFSIKDQPTTIEILLYDRRTRKVQLVEISDNRLAENMSLARAAPGLLTAKKTIATGARVRFTAFGQTIDAFTNKPFSSKKDAADFVNKWLREKERDFLIMQGKIVGLPDLRAREVHELVGMSKRLDGFYRFTNVKHTMKPGGLYVCEFTAYKVVSEGIVRR